MIDFETILEGERFKGHLKTVSVGSIRILTVNIPIEGKELQIVHVPANCQTNYCNSDEHCEKGK